MLLLQQLEQTLREHHVPNPGRADDEKTVRAVGQERGYKLTQRFARAE